MARADYFARQGSGGGAIFVSDLAAHDRVFIAVHLLDKPARSGWEIVNDLWRIKMQAVEVDQVDIRFHPRSQDAAIPEAIELSRLAGLKFYYLFQRQAGTALA